MISRFHNWLVALGVLFGHELPTVHIQIDIKATKEAAGLKKASVCEIPKDETVSSFLDVVFSFPVSGVFRL